MITLAPAPDSAATGLLPGRSPKIFAMKANVMEGDRELCIAACAAAPPS